MSMRHQLFEPFELQVNSENRPKVEPHQTWQGPEKHALSLLSDIERDLNNADAFLSGKIKEIKVDGVTAAETKKLK